MPAILRSGSGGRSLSMRRLGIGAKRPKGLPPIVPKPPKQVPSLHSGQALRAFGAQDDMMVCCVSKEKGEGGGSNGSPPLSLLSLLYKPPHRHPERARARARREGPAYAAPRALGPRERPTNPARLNERRPPLRSPEMAGVLSCADSESNREPKD